MKKILKFIKHIGLHDRKQIADERKKKQPEEDRHVERKK